MKLPVMTAFGATLAYLARHASDLARALWLPGLLLVALQLYAMPPFFAALASLLDLGPNPDPAAASELVGEFGKWLAILAVGSAVFYPMLTVASLIHLVRGEQPRTPFYLQYGGDELRVLAAYILLSLMIIAISIVGGLVASVIALLVALVLPQARAMASTLGELALNIVLAWFRLRLSVLFPAVVSTRTMGFGAAWLATKGNVWRLLGFWILVGIILAVVGLLVIAPFAGDFVPLFEQMMQVGDDEEAARAVVAAFIRAMADLYSHENPVFAIFAAALLAGTIVSTAIMNAAGGIAWRFLTDRAAPAKE